MPADGTAVLTGSLLYSATVTVPVPVTVALTSGWEEPGFVVDAVTVLLLAVALAVWVTVTPELVTSSVDCPVLGP